MAAVCESGLDKDGADEDTGVESWSPVMGRWVVPGMVQRSMCLLAAG